MYGNTAGNFIRDLMKAVKKTFPFRQLLNKILYKQHSDFHREHRNFKVDPFFIPRKQGEKFKIYVMIDTSGSVYDFTEDFMGYVMALPEFEELVMIDTQIQAIYKKGDPVPRVVPGGGGTDLNEGFHRWADIEKTAKSKCNFICLTDGEIPAITRGPIKSKTIILTTHEEVQYSNAQKKYVNYHIDKGDYE